MRAIYFTVTYELLKDMGITNLEIDTVALNKFLHLPENVEIVNIYQDFYDWQRNQLKITCIGDGLPLWAEKREGEMMIPCRIEYSFLHTEGQENIPPILQFIQDDTYCKHCGGYC